MAHPVRTTEFILRTEQDGFALHAARRFRRAIRQAITIIRAEPEKDEFWTKKSSSPPVPISEPMGAKGVANRDANIAIPKNLQTPRVALFWEIVDKHASLIRTRTSTSPFPIPCSDCATNPKSAIRNPAPSTPNPRRTRPTLHVSDIFGRLACHALDRAYPTSDP